MPTTNDRDKYEELGRRAEMERRKLAACISNTISLIAICVIVMALIYIITH